MTQLTVSCPKSCKTYCKARQLQQAFSQQGPFHSNETPETKAFSNQTYLDENVA